MRDHLHALNSGQWSSSPITLIDDLRGLRRGELNIWAVEGVVGERLAPTVACFSARRNGSCPADPKYPSGQFATRKAHG
jgi:hypothetical protein